MPEQSDQATNTLNATTNSLSTLSTSNLALAGTASSLIDPLYQRVTAASGFSASSPGVFTVGATGQVSLDYLFDGGTYQGDLAIFSLADTDRWLQDGSEAFAREVALRAVIDRSLGHLAISDLTEGARFSGSLSYEENFNAGIYKGAKTFSMRPGDKFGIMLVPNGTVEDVLYGRNLEGDYLPLFSIPSLNLNSTSYLTQLVETHPDSLHQVDGNVFGIEDLRLDNASDRDYNDVIFQVRGATGSAQLLDKAINPAYDWRNSEVGQKLMSYANVDGKGLTAQYYDNIDLTKFRGERTDASVNFDWGAGSPSVMSSPDTFSIRWTGQVEAQHSEAYTFFTQSDERVKLWVNGQLLINHWSDHPFAEDSGTIALTAGQKYDIKVEYAENTGNAAMKLLWSSSSQPKEIIPQNLLYSDPTAPPLDPKNGLEYRPNELSVKFQPNITDAQIQALAQSYAATGVERLVPFDPKLPSALDQWRILHFSPQANLPQLRDIFSRNTSVQLAELDYTIEFDDVPNDSSFKGGDLWGLNKIDAPSAWTKISPNSRKVIVGVLDTGVDYTHPDLAANIVPGYDFGDNDSDPMDDSVPDLVIDGVKHMVRGHGTHVAGTIGAVANNLPVNASGQPLAKNVVGVAQNVSIMPLKLVDSKGKGYFTNAARAIHFAATNGVRVLNASFSGPSQNLFLGFIGNDDNFGAMGDAIDDLARSEVVFVASAGNEGQNVDNPDNRKFPAGFSLFSNNVISVAATDHSDQLSTGANSNYGRLFVDLGAPGEGILSTVPFSVGDHSGYAHLSGTSMAAPHVTGAAALLLSQQLLSAAEVKNTLISTVDPVAALAETTVSGGRLNVAKALNSLYPERRVELTIHKVRGVDSLDDGGDANFYPEVVINGENLGRSAFPLNDYNPYKPIETDDEPKEANDQDDRAVTPNWRFIKKGITGDTVNLAINIWDYDNPGESDHADINPVVGHRDLNLSYNLFTNQVVNVDSGQILTPGGDGWVYSVGGGNDDRDNDEITQIWFNIVDSVN